MSHFLCLSAIFLIYFVYEFKQKRIMVNIRFSLMNEGVYVKRVKYSKTFIMQFI